MVLPCDLVCELGGEALLETWMVKEAGLGGATGGGKEFTGPKMALGGEKGGRRGGLTVYYQTKGETVSRVKGEETDFIATTPLATGPVPPSHKSLLPQTSNLVYATPTDTLNDIMEEKKGLPLRHGLFRKHAKLRMLSSHRDAHIYIFPAWVMDMINANDHMDTISEDVVGWWAKAGWQDGLAEKMGLRQIFDTPDKNAGDDGMGNRLLDDEVDIGSLSTTWTSRLNETEQTTSMTDSGVITPVVELKKDLVIPPILAYVHPSKVGDSLIRRVDTAPLLLSVSLQLAKLEAIDAVGRAASSPFAHTSKVAASAVVPQRATVTSQDCLIAENVMVEEKCSIKECVVGANCQIKLGAKLTRCVLMDGVVVGKGCKLTGCILGRRSVIGEESILQDCEVQENLEVIPQSKFRPCVFMDIVY